MNAEKIIDILVDNISINEHEREVDGFYETAKILEVKFNADTEALVDALIHASNVFSTYATAAFCKDGPTSEQYLYNKKLAKDIQAAIADRVKK